MQFQIIVVITTVISVSSSLRILGLFPHPGVSHLNFFQPIMLGLAEAGHDVTVVSHFPVADAPSNYKDLVIGGETPLSNVVDLTFFTSRPSFRYFKEFFMIYEWGRRSCEITMNSTAMENVLKIQRKFDVVIVEQFNSDCMIGVAWKLKAPVIGLSSTAIISYYYDRLGIPMLASSVPNSVAEYTDKMTFSQRMSNWIAGHSFPVLRRLFMDRSDNAILRRSFGEDMPSVTDLSKQISLMFVNTHYSLSGPKPLPPNVIELGGIHIREPMAIDEELKRLLDSSKYGVIYVSWGSMIRAESLPDEKREHLLAAFGSLKETVLWKYENDTLPNQPVNVHIKKWMPQREILCHPNVRVFLTHGGLLGSSEAAYCGVSVVATPMYGDQFYNAAGLVHRGMGIILEYEEITKETVVNAIKFALGPNTQENAKKVSYSFISRSISAMKTAVWWVEHVAVTGGAPLAKSNSTFMSWYEYHLLDMYAVFITAFVVFVGIWIWILKRVFGSAETVSKIKTN